MTTSEFIVQNRMGNPRDLALLSRRYPDVDMPYALNQIQGWQTARQKLPSWAECDGVVYPPHLNMEQCSSEPAARYKQEVVRRWVDKCRGNGPRQSAGVRVQALNTSMTDLTGGFGVDFSFTSRCFDEATYVERNAALCDVVRGNLPRLGIGNARVVCAEAEEYLEGMEPQTMIFLDPARRDEHGSKTVFIGDCTPDVTALLPQLMGKARFVVLKLSPMLDWHKAVADLQDTVSEVHVVSVGGECKELLLVLSEDFAEEAMRVVCVDISTKACADGMYSRSEFSYINGANQEVSSSCSTQSSHFTQLVMALCGQVPSGGSTPPVYLYEPNASVMKAGCFVEIASAYGVEAVSRNSHLFVSEGRVEGFPGRAFSVKAVTTMNKRELKKTLAGISNANIAVRNFPMSVADLRKRLKLKDGGDTYIFATTTAGGDHVLIVCRR